MLAFQLVQPEFERRIGWCVFHNRGRLCGWLRSGSGVGLWRFIRCRGLLIRIRRHFLRIEVEPFNGFQRRRMDAYVLHLLNEVEDVPAVLAFRETIPGVR